MLILNFNLFVFFALIVFSNILNFKFSKQIYKIHINKYDKIN